MSTTPAPKKVSPRKTAPPTVISEIHLIPLTCIEITTQVRTEFDDDSIKELAADIEQRGLLQPVLVTPIGDEKYRLVCGERRVRAIRLLKHKAIPAVITKMADRDARLAQLAENIQREDLTLQDRCNAVKWLYEELGSITAVAATIKRSKAWVSKLVSLTMDDYSFTAKELLANGITEDLEILGIVNQADLLGSNHAW
ncbi:MAG: ParB/RepB/Spo0J family partition protein, partial [Rhodocyclaceae bacterium]|nr:ParB/RepB/Spo0J family partition protein [Rhodocyclaceae bacterium]